MPRRFLLIGNFAIRGGAIERLKATGADYRSKRLESKPENWDTIINLIGDGDADAVLMLLNRAAYEALASPTYSNVGTRLLKRVREVAHIVFVHEALFTGADSVRESDRPSGDDDWQIEDYEDSWYRERFIPPDDEVRVRVNDLLAEYEINVNLYRTNAELSLIADNFIDASDLGLIFRLYVPTGKLWAAEAQQFFSLFTDWLARVRRIPIRQDGWETEAGYVYELFSDTPGGRDGIAGELEGFSEFLDLCMSDPDRAVELITSLASTPNDAALLVGKYAKRAKRLAQDLRHERELRLLTLRQQLETELEDEVDLRAASLEAALGKLIPAATNAFNTLALPSREEVPIVSIHVSQQIFERVEGVVAQSISGTVNLGASAQQVLELIHTYAGSGEALELQNAVFEAEDSEAPTARRVAAVSRLRTFLARTAERAGDLSVAVAQKWLESKLGL